MMLLRGAMKLLLARHRCCSLRWWPGRPRLRATPWTTLSSSCYSGTPPRRTRPPHPPKFGRRHRRMMTCSHFLALDAKLILRNPPICCKIGHILRAYVIWGVRKWTRKFALTYFSPGVCAAELLTLFGREQVGLLSQTKLPPSQPPQ